MYNILIFIFMLFLSNKALSYDYHDHDINNNDTIDIKDDQPQSNELMVSALLQVAWYNSYQTKFNEVAINFFNSMIESSLLTNNSKLSALTFEVKSTVTTTSLNMSYKF